MNNMTEQRVLFKIEEKPVDVDDDKYNRDYCFRQILSEEYLWDMRCWFKLKQEYSRDEVKREIQKWLIDKEHYKWTYNCGHCVFCMKRLLDNNWATIDEIVDL